MALLASTFDQSRFLSADDLKSGERKFKIKEVTAEDVGKENKLVVWFTNDKKGLVLNKTNNRVLRKEYGDDVSGWENRIIAVFVMEVLFQGRLTPGLRVRIPPPKQPSTKPPSNTTFMTRSQETQPLGKNGPVAAKLANKKTSKKKPPVPDDELDDLIESQPPPEDPDDELNDDIDM